MNVSGLCISLGVNVWASGVMSLAKQAADNYHQLLDKTLLATTLRQELVQNG